MPVWHQRYQSKILVFVYPISLPSDLCNVYYAVPIAVLTTKCKYLQDKYTKEEQI